jgi:hypothetical protein
MLTDKTNEIEPPLCERCGRRHFSKYTEARCALKKMMGVPLRSEVTRDSASSPAIVSAPNMLIPDQKHDL